MNSNPDIQFNIEHELLENLKSNIKTAKDRSKTNSKSIWSCLPCLGDVDSDHEEESMIFNARNKLFSHQTGTLGNQTTSNS